MVMALVLNEILMQTPQLGTLTSHQTGSHLKTNKKKKVSFLIYQACTYFRSPIHGSYSSWNNSADNQSTFEARVEDGKLFYEKRW